MKRKLICFMMVCICLVIHGCKGKLSEPSVDDEENTIIKANADKTIIIVDDCTISAGGKAGINVWIKNNPGVLGAILHLDYDYRLELLKAEAGEAFSSLTMTKPGELVPSCNFMWDGLDKCAEEDGVVLKLTFKVPDNANTGDSFDIKCSYSEGDVIDKDLSNIELLNINGTITVRK